MSEEKAKQKFEEHLNKDVRTSWTMFQTMLNNDPHSVFDIFSERGVGLQGNNHIEWENFCYVMCGAFNHIISKCDEEGNEEFAIIKNIPGRMEGFILNF